MIRATLLTCLLASPIAADTIHLREHPSAMAELFYRNDPAQNSVQGETRHEVNGIAVLVHITVGDSEIITVTPVNPAFTVWPIDPVQVPDGGEASILIVLPGS